jgi:hypothetical protein
MKPKKFEAVHSLVGGAISQLPDGNIVYHDGQTLPTEAEIDAEVIRLQAEYDAQEYARNRKTEYPPMADQLDYMFHNGFDKWKEDIVQPVKDKYPKPE